MANYTPNYQLHQWAPEDKFLRTDFNEDLNKIDTALGEGATKTAALEAAVNKCGNCRMECRSYIGTGRYGNGNPNSLTFSVVPKLVLIINPNGRTMFMNSNSVYAYGTGLNRVTWNGTSVSWYIDSNESDQFNERNTTYMVYVFYLTK